PRLSGKPAGAHGFLAVVTSAEHSQNCFDLFDISILICADGDRDYRRSRMCAAGVEVRTIAGPRALASLVSGYNGTKCPSSPVSPTSRSGSLFRSQPSPLSPPSSAEYRAMAPAR